MSEQKEREWTDEALRVAIAQACGWTEVMFTGRSYQGIPPNSYSGRFPAPSPSVEDDRSWYWIPRYTSDLNDMHGAEEVLLADEDTGYRYDMALCRIVGAYEVEGLCNHLRLFHATARQRCLAFCKTLGLSPKPNEKIS